MSMLLRDQLCVFPSQVSVKEKDMPSGDRWGKRPAVRITGPLLMLYEKWKGVIASCFCIVVFMLLLEKQLSILP